MTNEEIIRTAKELSMRHNADIFELDGDGLIAFAALIAAAERNRIADEAQYIIKRAEARGAAAERESCANILRERSMKFEKEAQDAIENDEHDEVTSLRSTAWTLTVTAEKIMSRGKKQ